MYNDFHRELIPYGREQALLSAGSTRPALPSAAAFPIFNWEQAVRVLLKNWRFTVAVALGATALLAVLALLLKDTYQPVARLELDPQPATSLSARELENDVEARQEYVETQAQILQSDDLATRVIRALRLDRNPEIVAEANLAKLSGAAPELEGAGRPPVGTAPLREEFQTADHSPLESIALQYFRKHLSVMPVRNSRLVEVSFATQDPRLSQKITNSLVSQFIDRNYRTRYESTMQASEWLAGQLSDLRTRVEESNQAVADYQKRYSLVDADEKDGPTATLAAQFSRQLSEAQADRIQAEAYVYMIDGGKAEELPQIRNNPVYQTITARYTDSRAKLAQAQAIYGEENSNYKKLLNEVNEVAAERDAEQARIIREVRASFSTGRERETLMLQAMDRLRVQIGDANERMVRYRVLKNEAQANAALYSTLLGRLKEAGVYAGLKSSNIRVVDPAPLLDKPTSPHRSLIISIGALLSSLLAMGLAFVKESLVNTVRTPDDVSQWTGLPSLAMIPLAAGRGTKALTARDSSGISLQDSAAPGKQKSSMPVLISPANSPVEAEALRSLGASILLSQGQRPVRTLLVASSVAGEGKSTVAINLATLLAQGGKTCLIDGDLRRPTLARAFGTLKGPGLSQVLAGSALCRVALVRSTGFDNLFLLPAGQVPSSPLEILACDQFRKLLSSLRQEFAYIVIDSPPVIPFCDARLFSSVADGVVLVARCGMTTRRSLMRGAQLLADAGAPILGVAVNGMDFTSADYHYFNYGYSRATRDANVYKYYRSLATDSESTGSGTNERATGAGA